MAFLTLSIKPIKGPINSWAQVARVTHSAYDARASIHFIQCIWVCFPEKVFTKYESQLSLSSGFVARCFESFKKTLPGEVRTTMERATMDLVLIAAIIIVFGNSCYPMTVASLTDQYQINQFVEQARSY